MSKKALWTQLPRYRKAKRRGSAGRTGVLRVRRVSRTLAKAKRAYNAAARDWLALPENRWCIACVLRQLPWRRCALEVHHKFGRRGALLMWQPGWQAVCAECHRFIHRNICEARWLGLYAPKGQWNKMPTVEVKPENCLVTAASLLEKTKC